MRGYLLSEEWAVIEVYPKAGSLATPDRFYEIPDELVAQHRDAIRVFEEAQAALLSWASDNGVRA